MALCQNFQYCTGEKRMKKMTSTLTICFLLLGLLFSDMASADQLIVPTDKSVIETTGPQSTGQATLKIGGDLAGKLDWVEVYYKSPQENGEYVNRYELIRDTAIINVVSVLGFNFGQKEGNFLMIDEIKSFPGKLIGIIQLSGGITGTKFGFK